MHPAAAHSLHSKIVPYASQAYWMVYRPLKLLFIPFRIHYSPPQVGPHTQRVCARVFLVHSARRLSPDSLQLHHVHPSSQCTVLHSHFRSVVHVLHYQSTSLYPAPRHTFTQDLDDASRWQWPWRCSAAMLCTHQRSRWYVTNISNAAIYRGDLRRFYYQRCSRRAGSGLCSR